MSEIFASAQRGRTLGLAILTLITGIFAGRAFWKQSRAVSDQTKMVRVQGEQLSEDRKINAEQIRVLTLQAVQVYMWQVPVHVEAVMAETGMNYTRAARELERRMESSLQCVVDSDQVDPASGWVANVQRPADEHAAQMAALGEPAGLRRVP
jgi:hypothetical protein